MPLKVTVDTSACIYATQCNEVAPLAYDIPGYGAYPVPNTDADRQKIIDGAKACPMDAITVIDTKTGKTLAP